MANQIIIDIGAVANDGTGDPLRTAFNYVNNNFSNVWDTGLPTSNVAFDGNRVLTINTNGNLILAPNGTGKVVANVDILPNISNVRNLGSLTRRWSTLYTQYLDATEEVNLSGDVTIGGNLIVEGDTIQIGNITTDSKTIQLANTAATANQANGSGVTVGANDDIATMLYDSTANIWNFNIGISASGNIAAPYFIGDGSQLSGMYGNANVAANLAAFGSNPISTTGNITAGYFLGDGSQLTGIIGGNTTQVQYNDNGTLAGNQGFTYNAANNTVLVSGNSTTGEHAVTFGASGFTELNANVIGQFTADANSYAQINFQNINSGNRATTDYIATAAFGTDSTFFVDMGIASNSYDANNPNNSLGNALHPQDSYLYSQGGNGAGTGGNLVVGSNEPGRVVRIIADGSFTDNIVATFSNTGIAVKGNITPVTSNIYSLGNSTHQWESLYVSNTTIYINNVPVGLTAGNVLTVNGEALLSNDSNTSITTTGNITADYFLGNGSQLTGLDTNIISNGTSNVSVATANGNVTVTAAGSQTWTFDTDGNIALPSGGILANPAQSSLDPINPNVATMVLTPDQSYSYQSLVLDPTAPGHIHLRAPSGTGNIDEPAANLYLGGEQSSFEVGASYGGAPNAFIHSGGQTWTFDNTGNLSAPGEVSATGNITGSYIIGNGSQLTGLPVPYNDSNVTTLLASFGSNTISTTGNITGNLVAPGANRQVMYNDNGVINGSTAFTFDENGNTLTIGTTGGTLKVADIQTPQAGVSLRLIPASGITYSYGNLLPLFANTYDAGGASNRWQTVFANVANLVTASISGVATASSITLTSTGTAVNASAGNVLTNQVTGTQFNFLNGLYTASINGGGATANYTLQLPANTGTNGQVLTTDGTGALSWSTPASTYGNSNVATFLAAFGSNTISTTGNITAGNISGNISVTGNVTGTSANVDIIAGSYTWSFNNTGNLVLPGNTFTVNYANGTAISLGGNYADSNVVTLLAAFGSNTVSTTGNVTSGNLRVTGAATTGVNALLAGPTFTPLSNTSAGFVANVNSYSQITFQNRSTGADATADYILTADNGSDTVNYGDFGIINSGYDNNTPTNSLGNIVFAGDTYVYAQGNVSNTSQSGGNLVLGTATAAKYVKIFAGGNTNSALVANISNTGVSVTGNVTASNFIGNISLTGNIQGTSANVELVAGSYTFTFDNTGVATFPAVGGDEGGEINFGIPAANTTLTSPVKVDVYQDRIRFFDGSTKGAYIDLSQAATGIGTLLNNRVSGIVNAGTFVTMDNIKATVTSSAPRGLSLATVSGTLSYNIGGNFAMAGGPGGSVAAGQTLSTTPTGSIFGWGFVSSGDLSTYVLTDTTNNRCYRITVQIGASFNNNSIVIERLI